ncbi:tRNA 2-selenouridine(34) synthase MnmH [Campylobacter sp. faydin G-24]|uniref:tRNA 2-selenouridine(34) synthase MnmH n=1 Tax=Campylobacter anatolicus TaxID=2829105 RepID=A0ABS5HIG5_9BACT|nr:tRNA 2-selenouridine(34) synthase MnmH [Campylobacter anatolicus]MBR8462774.1 tRNA 2-selenouridine(34) synthase MnmH [Campylobacter anatolicus]MBR8464059.1 tRNA 2-selenouridine(34) synthase MnmH [Campylobacter anatolicus]
MSLRDLCVDEWLGRRNNYAIIIDARSPREFEYSHIKDAINLYALSDKQYQEIGIIYKHDRAYAKALGASYICANLQDIIKQVYKLCKVGSLLGIYCAKGGMRSNSIGVVLSMIGYRVERLGGGYKAYRTQVLSSLNKPCSTKFITLFGNTGSYKTKLIQALNPSINLEKMANHLGSVFGAIAGAQPSQKCFEDGLFERLLNLKDKVCFIEGESRKIGSLTLPTSIYEAMRSGVNVEITASLHRRIECIMSDYANIDDKFFYECMNKISPFISRDAKDDANAAFERGDIAKVCEILLIKYYDKVYKKPSRVDVRICSDDFKTALDELNDIRSMLVK